MRASRLLSILILLQIRGRITADALAAEFEVSTRTIYRDVDELSAAGIPVQSDRGPGGGFQLLDGYRTHLTGLASDEAEAMFMIGMPGPASALGLGGAATEAGRKLLASLPPGASEGAGRIGARFHLDPVEWYRIEETVQHLPELARAVLDQHVVTMRYESWTATREWRIEPLGLVLKAGAWYLVARGGKKIRIFKVANILEQAVQTTTFERPRQFDLPNYWTNELARFEAGLRPESATLRASPIGLKRLSVLGAYALEAVQKAGAADSDGWTRLRLPIENTEQAALLCLGIGSEIEVIEPHVVRVRLREMAKQVARRSR